MKSKIDTCRIPQPLRRFRALVIAWVVALSATGDPALAGGVELLEGLERERAALIAVLLDPERTAADRERYERATKRRLADMERIVLRDDGLLGKSGPMVRRAFARYELTFLAHAAAERGRTILDLWLEQVGLTTDAVLNAQPGRRL